MKFNRTVMKSLAFAVALGSVSFLGYHSAKAAAPTLTFDGASAKLTIASGTNYWGVAKKLKAEPKKKNASHVKIGTAWYQVKKVESMVNNEVDLSRYKGKAVIVAVGSSADLDGTKWVVKEIPAGVKKFKVTSDDLSSLKLFDGTKSLELTEDENIEVRVGAGDWQAAETYFGNDFVDAGKKLAVLNQKGANLTFRYKGTATAWGSNEAKLKVPAQRKGPSIKFDVVKDTSNIKKNVQFQTIKEGEDLVADAFTKAPEKAKLSQLNIKNTNDADGKKTQFIYFKEAAVGKKAPSRLSKVIVKKTEAPTLKSGLSASGIAGQGSDIIENEVAINLAVVYDVSKGAVITNKSTENDYEVAIDYERAESAQEATAQAALKWIQLKKTKDADKPTTIKIAASTAKKANTFNPAPTASNVKHSKIYVRKAGKKQEGNVVTLPSPAIGTEIKMVKIDQKISITKGDDDTFAHTDTSGAVTLKVAKTTDTTFELAAKITNPVKASGKPKVSVTKALAGVSVKTSELVEGSGEATFNITVHVSNTAFSTDADGSQKMDFKVLHEGAEKIYNVTFQKKS